jgi:hypothetical protein
MIKASLSGADTRKLQEVQQPPTAVASSPHTRRELKLPGCSSRQLHWSERREDHR